MEANEFKLFFSFDMATQSEVSYFLPMFEEYQFSPAFYTHADKPFVSTLYGANNPERGMAVPVEGCPEHGRD